MSPKLPPEVLAAPPLRARRTQRGHSRRHLLSQPATGPSPQQKSRDEGTSGTPTAQTGSQDKGRGSDAEQQSQRGTYATPTQSWRRRARTDGSSRSLLQSGSVRGKPTVPETHPTAREAGQTAIPTSPTSGMPDRSRDAESPRDWSRPSTGSQALLLSRKDDASIAAATVSAAESQNNSSSHRDTGGAAASDGSRGGSPHRPAAPVPAPPPLGAARPEGVPRPLDKRGSRRGRSFTLGTGAAADDEGGSDDAPLERAARAARATAVPTRLLEAAGDDVQPRQRSRSDVVRPVKGDHPSGLHEHSPVATASVVGTADAAEPGSRSPPPTRTFVPVGASESASFADSRMPATDVELTPHAMKPAALPSRVQPSGGDDRARHSPEGSKLGLGGRSRVAAVRAAATAEVDRPPRLKANTRWKGRPRMVPARPDGGRSPRRADDRGRAAASEADSAYAAMRNRMIASYMGATTTAARVPSERLSPHLSEPGRTASGRAFRSSGGESPAALALAVGRRSAAAYRSPAVRAAETQAREARAARGAVHFHADVKREDSGSHDYASTPRSAHSRSPESGRSEASESGVDIPPPSDVAIRGLELYNHWAAGQRSNSASGLGTAPLKAFRTAEQVDEQHGHITLHTFEQTIAMQELMSETGYNRRELIALFSRFKALCALSPRDDGIDRETFRRGTPLLSVEDRLFTDRVFDVLDDDNGGTISWSEYLNAMSSLEKGSRAQRLAFLFSVYDEDGTGAIGKAELFKFFIASLRVSVDDHIRVTGEVFVEEFFEKILGPDHDRDYVTLEDCQAYLDRNPEITDIFSLFGRTITGHFMTSKWTEGDDGPSEQLDDSDERGVPEDSIAAMHQRLVEQQNGSPEHLHEDPHHSIPTVISMNVTTARDQWAGRDGGIAAPTVSTDWARLAQFDSDDDEDAEKLVAELQETAKRLHLADGLGPMPPKRPKRATSIRRRPVIEGEPTVDASDESEASTRTVSRLLSMRRESSTLPSVKDYVPKDGDEVTRLAQFFLQEEVEVPVSPKGSVAESATTLDEAEEMMTSASPAPFVIAPMEG